MNRFGFVRVTCASIRTSVAYPEANAAEIVRVLAQVADSDIVVFPELCVTGYTCADLFGQAALLQAGFRAIQKIVQATAGHKQLVIIGLPVPAGNSLFNCALVLSEGKILGIVPKQNIPNYKEFYESRWFRGADGSEPAELEVPGGRVPFGIDLLFECQEYPHTPVVVGIEICEDLWVPIPPSSVQAGAGATILLNLSASNETIGKSQYRTELVVGQSGRCIAAYAYAGAGPSESTTDLVFGGHCLIAENGQLAEESPRVGDGQPIRRDSYWITRDVDVAKLLSDRRVSTSFEQGPRFSRPCRRIAFGLAPAMSGPQAVCPGHSLRAGGRARTAPPLRRDLRHPVRGAGQAHRAAAAPDAAEHRDLRRARLHALALGRRQDVRPSGHRPAPDPRTDDARLRHDRADQDQRPGPHAAPWRLVRDHRHRASGPPGLPRDRTCALRHRLSRARRRIVPSGS